MSIGSIFSTIFGLNASRAGYIFAAANAGKKAAAGTLEAGGQKLETPTLMYWPWPERYSSPRPESDSGKKPPPCYGLGGFDLLDLPWPHVFKK